MTQREPGSRLEDRSAAVHDPPTYRENERRGDDHPDVEGPPHHAADGAGSPATGSKVGPKPSIRPAGAPSTSPSFCSDCGMSGRRTSSKWWFAITASRNGFGMPLRFVLPAAASEYIVAISRSNWSAGVTVQTNRASSSPAFQNLCGVPGSTTTVSPAASSTFSLQ